MYCTFVLVSKVEEFRLTSTGTRHLPTDIWKGPVSEYVECKHMVQSEPGFVEIMPT